MASQGEIYNTRLLSGEYDLLWVTTPADWFVRTPGKRENPHWRRILDWMKRAAGRLMKIIIYGPPCTHIWRIPNFWETARELNLRTHRLHLCHFGEKYNRESKNPSKSYIQIVSNMSLPYGFAQCNCGNIEHDNDWYGKTQPHADWRYGVNRDMTKRLCDLLHKDGGQRLAAGCPPPRLPPRQDNRDSKPATGTAQTPVSQKNRQPGALPGNR